MGGPEGGADVATLHTGIVCMWGSLLLVRRPWHTGNDVSLLMPRKTRPRRAREPTASPTEAKRYRVQLNSHCGPP